MSDEEIIHSLERALTAALEIAENRELPPRERVRGLGMAYALLQQLMRERKRVASRKTGG